MSRLARSEMNKRFEILIAQMEKHYVQIDKRIDQIGRSIDQIEKRFDQIERHLEQADKRFESMQQQMEIRLDALTRRTNHFMVCSFSTTVATGGIIISVLKVWS